MKSFNKLYTNSFYTMVGKVFTIIGNVLIVPFIIKSLGLKSLGQWELILSVLTLIVLFQTSLGFTLIWKFSSDVDDNTLPRWLGIGSFLGFLEIILFIVLFIFLKKGFLIGFDPQLNTALLIVIAVTLLSSFIEVGAALLNSKQLSGYVAIINGTTFLFTTVLSIYLLKYRGYNINALILCYALQKIIYSVFIIIKLRGITQLSSFLPKAPNKDEWKILGPYILSVLMGAVLIASRDQLIKFMVARYSTFEMVANYAIIIKISQILFLIPSFFVLPGIATIAEHYAKKEHDVIDATFNNISDIINAIVIWCSFILLFYLKEIIHMWTGVNNKFDYNLAYIIISLISYIIVITGSLSILIKGVGKVLIETYYIIFNLILSLFIVFLINYFYGINYAIISSFISWVISGIYYLVKAKRSTDIDFRSIWRSLFLMTICMGVVIIKNTLIANTISLAYCLVSGFVIIPVYIILLNTLRFFPKVFAMLKLKLNGNSLQ